MTSQPFTGVQILRFMAAMLVVLMHITQAISLRISGMGPDHYWADGSAGVDIFFVISGFVMATSTARLPSAGQSGLNAAWIFMKRRLLRIAPLYWFYTLLKAALVLAVPSLALRSSIDPGHFTSSLLFIPAMSPWGLIEPTLPVGWTLNFEMLFYGVLALAMAWGVPRIRFCLTVFLLLFLAGRFYPEMVPLDFYAQSLVFEFILGMGIAYLYLNDTTLPPPAGLLTAVAGVVFMFGMNWNASTDRFVTWGLGAALLVIGAVWLEPWTRRLRMASRLAFLGDASYSIYLSHTFVVPAAVLLMKQLGVQNSLIIIPVVSLAVVATGCLSYAWLERPMTGFLKRTLFRPSKLSLPSPPLPLQMDLMAQTAARKKQGRYIYIACPWTPKGGGMFKVADYLIQAQHALPSGATELRPLDTRGGAHALYSFWVLSSALARLVRGRLSGQLAGVHVNMAERLSLFRKSAVVLLCHALGIPVVLHLHAAQLHHFYRALPRPLQGLTRWVFSLPTSCVVLGSAAQRFVTEELRVPPSRVEIIINGVPEPSHARRQSDDHGVQQVLFLGNLSERKGVSDLLQALALPGFDTARTEVILAGGGDVPAYQAQAQQLGIDGFVRFAGWSDQQEVARLMAQADVLVLPSYDEGLPLVILEALANGVAVVCSPVGEIPSVLDDGVNACFVQPGDVAGIAAALQRVLQEPAFRQELERNGRALYEQRFSLARFSASVANIHQRHFGLAGQAIQSSAAPRKASP